MKALLRPATTAVLCTVFVVSAAASAPDADISNLGSAPNAHEQKGDAEAVAMKAELEHVKEAVNAARKPEDLDPLLFELQKYQNNGINGTFTPENQELVQQLVGALEFTKQWQNYLSHTASGQTDQARNDLSSLSQNNFGLGIIPRSRILALLAGQAAAPTGNAPAPTPPVTDAQKIVDGINTLDDLESALGRLNSLASQDGLARDYAQHLAPMVEIYDDLKNGLPTNVSINFMGDVTGPGISAKANSMLLKFILQHYFDTYAGAPPAERETPAAYSSRVKNDALTGRDWPLLKKTLTVHAYLFRNVAGLGGAADNEAAGLDDMITGINQDEAGQYALAVASFQTALKAGSLDIPAKFIGEKLDAIKRDHPAEYDAGMETFLAPPAPQYYPGMNPALYYSMNPALRYRLGMPGFPGNLPAQQSPVISIPAAKTNAPAPTTSAPSAAPK